jgi:hypothetical protein
MARQGEDTMEDAERKFWYGVSAVLAFVMGVFAGYSWFMFHYWDILQVVAFS